MPLYGDKIGIGFADGSIKICKPGGLHGCEVENYWYGAHTQSVVGMRVLRDGGLIAVSQAGPGAPIEICRWSFNGYPFSQQPRSNCVVM